MSQKIELNIAGPESFQRNLVDQQMRDFEISVYGRIYLGPVFTEGERGRIAEELRERMKKMEVSQ